MKKIILFVVATILCFLGFVASAHSAQKAVVSFTFDDGYVSVYRNAFVKLRVFDFPATVYVATSLIHKEAGVKMSWEQMKLLSQYGWEVGCHTHSHKNITRLSQEELSFEINTSISLLNEHGFKVQAFAPPHGDLDETAMPLIKNKFTSSRRAWKAKSLDDDLNSFVGLDRFNIESFELKHTTKIEEVKRLITRVVKEKKWLVFFAHAIVSTEPSEYQFATEKFNEIVNFVAEFVEKKQAEVLTISQALGYEDKHKKYEAIEAPVAGKVALVEKKTVSKISVKPMVVAEEAPAELAKEEKDKFPLALPFSSWGEVRWGNGKINEGLVLDSYFEQGADLYRWGNFTFNSFIGLRVSQSSENRDYWNNKFGPWFGVKIKHPFKLFPRAWGELSLGVRGEYYVYTSSFVDDNDLRIVPFFQWSFGGDWYDFDKKSWDRVPGEDNRFPLAYPFSSWGEVRRGNGKINEGLVLDSYFEQGVDWFRWRDFTFNSFVGLRLSQSSENRDYWNNKFGPWFGVKVKHPFKLFPRAWGELSLGVRGEYYNYTSSAIDDNEFRAVLFFQWSFGGDWYDYNKGGW